MKDYLVLVLGVGFLLLAFNAYQDAKPTTKAAIYKEIKKYSPYYLDKRFGGLEILNREDRDFKEKPNNMEIFHRFEKLEKEWGKKHLQIDIDNNSLKIVDKNLTIKIIPFKSKRDIEFIHKYYGI